MAATAVANNPEDIVAASYVGFDCAYPTPLLPPPY